MYYYIPTFLSQEPTARGNAYKVAKALGIAAPGKKNDARNDVEMIRRVLEYIQFPQADCRLAVVQGSGIGWYFLEKFCLVSTFFMKLLLTL